MNANTQIGRFFSFKNAAAAVGAVVLGLAIGGYVVHRIINENRISIGGLALAGLLVLVGLALFVTTAFPKGCKRCGQPFKEEARAMAGEHFHLVQQALMTGDVQRLQWAAQTTPSHGQRTTLTIEYCPTCRAVGVGSAALERSNGQEDETVQSTDEIVLAPAVIGAVIALPPA